MNWLSPKLRSLNTKKYGRGIFALEEIKKGEVLAHFGGKIIHKNEFSKLPERVREFPYQIDEDFFYGPTHEDDLLESDNWNHSCNPNSGFCGQTTLIAMRKIKKGEEVTFDYATCSTSDLTDMECMCGSKNCRKKILSTDWKNPKIQKKYHGYFQPYIEKKIEKLKKR